MGGWRLITAEVNGDVVVGGSGGGSGAVWVCVLLSEVGVVFVGYGVWYDCCYGYKWWGGE